MKLFIKPTTVQYASSKARVILVATDSEEDKVTVYMPNNCKRVPGAKVGVVPTWRPEGVLNTRLSTVVNTAFGGKTTEWKQAEDHTPAQHFDKLMTMLNDNPFKLDYTDEVVTLQPTVGTVMPDRSKLNNVIKTLIGSLGHARIKNVKILGMDDHPEDTGKPDCAAKLEQAIDIVNGVFSNVALDDAVVTMSDVGGNISLPDFADIIIDASKEEEVCITLSFKHNQHYSAIDVRKSHEITQAVVAVIRHVIGDHGFAKDTAVKLEVTLMKQNDRKTATKGGSILDVTHRPDVRFKLPVTPVLYNYTNITIEVEGAQVIPQNRNLHLGDVQYEGNPVIGVILDFSHPIAGLHDLRSVRLKNPNIPVYILWNSDEGPVLELYNE